MYLTEPNAVRTDKDVWHAIHQEAVRQQENIELIASENYCSKEILEAQGSILTNKYAEGYPGKRYYGGCEYVDEIEELAIERARQLFEADYVNVQPHSGSQANAAVYAALCQPGDTVLGMKLDQGGHLTHGSTVNFSGKVYQSVQYGLSSRNSEIDYEQVAALARDYSPKMIIAGFSAYPRTIDWQRFRGIADEVGAYLMADVSHIAGLIATGLSPSPVNIADVTTTTTHKTLRGPRGGLILAKSNPEIEKKLNSAIFPQLQGGPLLHVIAAKAIAFKEALQPEFKAYQKQVLVNAKTMCEALSTRGFDLVSNGTDNHMLLLNLVKNGITGRDADRALHEVGITVNKNAIPGDPLPASITSGIRIGTPAITTRGFHEKEAHQVATWIADLLSDINNESLKNEISTSVINMCRTFPVYQSATDNHDTKLSNVS